MTTQSLVCLPLIGVVVPHIGSSIFLARYRPLSRRFIPRIEVCPNARYGRQCSLVSALLASRADLELLRICALLSSHHEQISNFSASALCSHHRQFRTPLHAIGFLATRQKNGPYFARVLRKASERNGFICLSGQRRAPRLSADFPFPPVPASPSSRPARIRIFRCPRFFPPRFFRSPRPLRVVNPSRTAPCCGAQRLTPSPQRGPAPLDPSPLPSLDLQAEPALRGGIRPYC